LPLKVYERAVHVVEEKYGRDANIEFTWRGIVATYQIPQEAVAGAASASRSPRARASTTSRTCATRRW
jgi:putative hemolysin